MGVRIELIVVPDYIAGQNKNSYDYLSDRAANIVKGAILENPKLVLAPPAGSTQKGMYAYLIAMCSQNQLSFQGVKTFNLDEFVGENTYRKFMDRTFFDYIDIISSNTHIPAAIWGDPEKEAAMYEGMIAEAGGLDMVVLGIGPITCHLGFNEPGSPFDSRTRVVSLTEETRQHQVDSKVFYELDKVPYEAITMGLGTICDAGKIILMARANKAMEIAMTLEYEISPQTPSTVLRTEGVSPRVTLLVEEGALALCSPETLEKYKVSPLVIQSVARQ